MIGVVVAAHGRLGQEMIATAEGIVGPLEAMAGVSMDPSEGTAAIGEKIRAAMAQVDRGEGVLILTDMFGGTPANVSLSCLEEDKVEVLTGVNLPMLLKLATSRQERKPLRETARLLTAYGQRNVCLASDLLRSRERGG